MKLFKKIAVTVAIAAIFACSLLLTSCTDKNFVDKSLTEDRVVTSLELDVSADEVEILPSTDGKLTINYYESDKTKFKYTFTNGTARFEREINPSVNWSNDRPEIRIFLPTTVNDTIDINLSSGEVSMQAVLLSVKKLKIDVSSGDVDIDTLTAVETDIHVSSRSLSFDNCNLGKLVSDLSSGSIDVDSSTVESASCKVSSGTLNLGLKGSIDDYTVYGNASSGDVTLYSAGKKVSAGDDFSYGSGEKSIAVRVSSGNAKIKLS